MGFIAETAPFDNAVPNAENLKMEEKKRLEPFCPMEAKSLAYEDFSDC